MISDVSNDVFQCEVQHYRTITKQCYADKSCINIEIRGTHGGTTSSNLVEPWVSEVLCVTFKFGGI